MCIPSPAEGGVSVHWRRGPPLPRSVCKERKGRGSARGVPAISSLLGHTAEAPLASWDQEEFPWTHPSGTLWEGRVLSDSGICSGQGQMSPEGHPAPQASTTDQSNCGGDLEPENRCFQARLSLQTPKSGCSG